MDIPIGKWEPMKKNKPVNQVLNVFITDVFQQVKKVPLHNIVMWLFLNVVCGCLPNSAIWTVEVVRYLTFCFGLYEIIL